MLPFGGNHHLLHRLLCSWLLLLTMATISNSANLNPSGHQCGSRLCGQFEYCSEFDTLCEPCERVCEKTSRHFDAKVCETHCQAYDRFVRETSEENIKDEIRLLHTQVTITMSLTLILLVLFILVVVYRVIQWQKKHKMSFAALSEKLRRKEPKKKADKVITAIADSKPELRLNMTSVTNVSEMSNSPGTTVTRLPSEDVAPGGYAYDNHGMATTPTSTATRKRESSF